MSTPFQRATLLLAASLAATGVASQSRNRTITPTATTTTAPAASITKISAVQDVAASSGPTITFSTTAATSALPTAASLQGDAGNEPSRGFGAKLKKIHSADSTNSTSKAKRSLKARDDFDSNIVDSWLVVLEVGTPAQELLLSLDLGSDGLVVESTLVEANMQTTAYPIYNPDNSTSAQRISGYAWETAYVRGSFIYSFTHLFGHVLVKSLGPWLVQALLEYSELLPAREIISLTKSKREGFTIQGEIWTDVVTMSGTTWANMTMEVVTAEPVGSAINTATGILGVADHLVTGASPYYVNSFLGSIQNQLATLVFTVWFSMSFPMPMLQS